MGAFDVLTPPNPDYRDAVSAIEVPSLLVIGDSSPVVTLEMAMELRKTKTTTKTTTKTNGPSWSIQAPQILRRSLGENACTRRGFALPTGRGALFGGRHALKTGPFAVERGRRVLERGRLMTRRARLCLKRASFLGFSSPERLKRLAVKSRASCASCASPRPSLRAFQRRSSRPPPGSRAAFSRRRCAPDLRSSAPPYLENRGV